MLVSIRCFLLTEHWLAGFSRFALLKEHLSPGWQQVCSVERSLVGWLAAGLLCLQSMCWLVGSRFALLTEHWLAGLSRFALFTEHLSAGLKQVCSVETSFVGWFSAGLLCLQSICWLVGSRFALLTEHLLAG